MVAPGHDRASPWRMLVTIAAVVLSVAMAALAFALAPGHLSDSGILASRRDADPTLYRLHQLFGVAALINAVLVVMKPRLLVLFALAAVGFVWGNVVLFILTW